MSDAPGRLATWPRFRFSLRTLIAVTTVFAAILGLVSNEAIRLRRHREAARTVHSLGGRYVWYCDDQREPRGPRLLPIVTDSLYADEGAVWFNSSKNAGLQDNDLRVLTEFPRLRVVEICASGITDEGLVHLESVGALRRLVLQETKVTGAGLRRLGHLPIEQLVMGQTPISDESLDCLGSFQQLKKLAVYQTSVTDDGLKKLSQASNLEHLYIDQSPVSDEGMRHVAGLHGLKVLELRDLDVGDEGIAELSRLPHLETLELTRLRITDKAFGLLASYPSLRRLSIERTGVTEAGVSELRDSRSLRILSVGPDLSKEALQRLQEQMPNCRVYDSGGSIRFHGP